YAFEIDAAGNKWFATNMGVSKFDGVNWTVYTTANGLANNIVSALAIDQNNNFWFGTWGGGVSRFNGNQWTTFTQANYVHVIKSDVTGNIWFGTASGLKKFDGNTWTNYTTSNGLAANSVFAITFDQANNKWFGTNAAGVSKFNGNAFTTYNTSNGLIGNMVNASAIDNNGNLWIGTADGVSLYQATISTIKENANADLISIFPNPTQEIINMNSSMNIIDTKFSITDQAGKPVMEGILESTEINIKHLETGIYIFNLRGKNNFTKKIIKN
ncbi:MAG: two-component regulator propeller domain-containing protein, partial [Bacteroidia bacterium]